MDRESGVRMGEQQQMFPSGLTGAQFRRLSALTNNAPCGTPTDIVKEALGHLDKVRKAYAQNHMINLRLATAICQTIAKAAARWEVIPENNRSWLMGAFTYFVTREDDEPDFRSPIGFEDDTEVLNACLRFAQMDDLCVDVEEYDDV
jgi:uncharacterized membrane protein YkvA (DUF1232 family)